MKPMEKLENTKLVDNGHGYVSAAGWYLQHLCFWFVVLNNRCINSSVTI